MESAESIHFNHTIIDHADPVTAWGKSTGDINGDDRIDLIVGGHQRSSPSIYQRILRKLGLWNNDGLKGELVWYQNPGWEKHLISNLYSNRTDLEVGDIDGDTKNDVVVLTDSGLAWLRNPDWSRTQIDNKKLHDVEVIDFDSDDDLDIVARSQSLFNYNNGNEIHIYRQDAPDNWLYFSLPAPHGEGLKVDDIDQDNLPDIIVNNIWYKNLGVLDPKIPWIENEYGKSWT